MSTINVLKTVLTAEDQGFTRVMKSAEEKTREYNKVMKQAEEVYKSTRTPLEQYEAGIAKLDALVKRGAIDQETYNRAMRQAKDAFATTDKSLSALSGSFGSAGRAVGGFAAQCATGNPIVIALAVATAGLTVSVIAAKTAYDAASAAWDAAMEAIRDYDALDDAATKIGIATGALAGLRYAAGFAGVGAEKLDGALAKMNTTLGKAVAAGKGQEEIFSGIGLTFEQLANMQPDAAFKAIAEAISQIENPAQRSAAAVAAFGKSGADLLPLLVQGGAAIDDYQEKAKKMGLVLSEWESANVVEAADAMDDLGNMIKGAALQLANAMSPILTAVNKALVDMGTNGMDMGESIQFGFEIAIHAAANLLNLLQATWRTMRAIETKGASLVTEDPFGKLLGTSLIEEYERAKAEQAGKPLPPRRKGGPIEPGEDGGGMPGSSPWDEMQREGRRVADSVRTPVEVLQDEIMRLEGLFAAGAINVEEFTKAMEKAEKEFEKPEGKPAKTPTGKTAAEEVADMIAADLAKKMEEGARLMDQLRTPVEKFDAEILRLMELFDAGAIDWETVNRGWDAAAKQLDAAEGKGKRGMEKKDEKFDPKISALERGSREAFSAINAARFDRDIAKSQLDELRTANGHWRKWLERPDRKMPVGAL